ncbi:helix-turn-helix domain-containing protein [Pilimelia columellifera subsp. columellifera]|uniref:Helix-turn-helix domain-containing protein n=1 Tax=Pilimelia columellifera subsp. columellifera TaxID=706583 RepID=A0ABN3N6E0_9ACTN
MRDPQELRAIAHPIRLRLLDELFLSGPATATELSDRVGQSPANCSWHLRQLARYGYVEEADGGVGRRRPWRAVFRGRAWGGPDESVALSRAGDAATEVLFTREFDQLRRWQQTRRDEPAEWRDAGFVDQTIGWLTAPELAELAEELYPLLMRYADRVADSASRPPGARPVRFVAWGVPVPPTDS